VAKLGSNAIPRRPRSPDESTVRLTNGVLSNEPVLITRSWPPCWQTKSRPAGAKAIAVGEPDRLPANYSSVNPDGKLAAVARHDTKVSGPAITSSRIALKLERGMWKDRCDLTWFDCWRTTVIQDPLGIKAPPSVNFNLELI
jgi:hypothetical protein